MEIQGPTPNATQGLLTIIVLHNPPNNALFSLGLGIMWHWGGCPQIRMNSVAATQKKQIPNHWGPLSAIFGFTKTDGREIAWELVDSAGCQHRLVEGRNPVNSQVEVGCVCVCVCFQSFRRFVFAPSRAENLNHQTCCK